MIDFLKAHKAVLLKIFELSMILLVIILTFYILDAKHSEKEDTLKHYIDSTNAVKSIYIKDISVQMDSVKNQNIKLQTNENHVKTLNHSALQHYIDSISSTKR